MCKGVCCITSQIFVHNSKKDKLGIDVYFCRQCNFFIKFKEILTNFINTIFHSTIKKLRCGCCGSKLRVKLRPKRLRLKRNNKVNKVENPYKPELYSATKKCECGCGIVIPIINKWYNKRKYVNKTHAKNHLSQKIDDTRRCLFCNSDKTRMVIPKGKDYSTPLWHKYNGNKKDHLCDRCYSRVKYRQKKIASVHHTPLILTYY